MPTLEDVLPRLHGVNYFSALDASTGFWQICFDEESSSLCTMSTPYGRYKFLRMPFGIASAPEVFQRAMHKAFDGLTDVSVVMDDLLVWESSREEHDKNLFALLTRCRDHNLKLNRKKCRFLQSQVRYMGYALSSQGLHLDPEWVDDIVTVTPPQNRHELQVFSAWLTLFHGSSQSCP